VHPCYLPWSIFNWALWSMLLSVATATACATHLDVHQETHSPLCLHSSSPAAQRHDKPILFGEEMTFPRPRPALAPVVSPASLSSGLLLTHAVLPHQPVALSEHLFMSTPRPLLPVLRR